MTDVTGFGLAGHAARMADASGLTVEIDLATMPVFAGAEALAEGGVRSTIWQANRDAVSFYGPDTPRSTLLFDPQTAGGFLAAIPADAAGQVVDDLIALGHRAADIGTLVDRGEFQIIVH